MSRLKWDETYSVGNREIDRQHQDLFALIDRLEDKDLDVHAMRIVFEKLDIYVEEHFRDEEALMARAGFDDLDAHIRLHDEFRQWLRSAKNTFKTATPDHTALGRNLQAFLQEWFLRHILTADQAYKKRI